MKKELICIVCPNSCRLTVSEQSGEITVSGHECKRGLEHGLSEYRDPRRMLTSTVAISGGALPRLPVISTTEVPREMLGECLEALYAVGVAAPVKAGDIIVGNICGTGIDVIASRSMSGEEQRQSNKEA